MKKFTIKNAATTLVLSFIVLSTMGGASYSGCSGNYVACERYYYLALNNVSLQNCNTAKKYCNDCITECSRKPIWHWKGPDCTGWLTQLNTICPTH